MYEDRKRFLKYVESEPTASQKMEKYLRDLERTLRYARPSYQEQPLHWN